MLYEGKSDLVTIVNVEKHLANEYKKGIVEADGKVKPFRLEMW